MREGCRIQANRFATSASVVHDPEFGPYFGPGEIARGSDIPGDVLRSRAPADARTGEGGRGRGQSAVITAFEGAFLGSLIHA